MAAVRGQHADVAAGTAALIDVAVVVPTIDGTGGVRRCLGALLRERVQPREIVVVDQSAAGQRAQLADYATALAEAGGRLSHLYTPERGVSRARNRGVRECGAGLIAFTDDDCVPGERWVETLVEACEPAVDGVTGRVLPLPSTQVGLVAVSSRTAPDRRRFSGTWPHAPWEAGTGGNLLLRRAAFELVGGFDERLGPGAPGRAGEDVDLLYRLLVSGSALAYEPQATVYHKMKTRAARQRGRYAYGYGMGAFLGGHAAERDRTASRLLGRYLGDQVVKTLAAARRRALLEMDEGIRSLAGALAGYVHFRHAGDARRPRGG